MKALTFLCGVLIGILLASVGLALMVAVGSLPSAVHPLGPPADTAHAAVRISEGLVERLANDLARQRSPNIQWVKVNVLPDQRAYVKLAAQVYLGDVLMDVQLLMEQTMAIGQEGIEFSVIKVQQMGSYWFSDERLARFLGIMPQDLAAEMSRQVNGLLPQEGLVPVEVSSDPQAITFVLQTEH